MCGRASADKRRWPSGRSSLLFSKSSRASWRKWTGAWARRAASSFKRGWDVARAKVYAGGKMSRLLAVLGALVFLAVLIGATYVNRRNEMVRKSETVKATWAEVDVVLQRRADLIPNLRSEERRVGKECRSRWSPY